MNKLLPAAALAAVAPFLPQDPQDAARQARELAEAAIELAALDYLEGIYELKPRYITRSVHPSAMRIGLSREGEESPFGDLARMDFDQIVQLAGSFNRDGHVPDDAPRDLKILDVVDVTASARLKTAWGFDYLQLAKVDDEWMITGILWQTFDHSQALPEVSTDAVAAGAALFASARCTNCHGDEGSGGQRAPDLTDGEWLHSPGDVDGIAATIAAGVPRSRIKGGYPRAMGAFGNRLSPDEVDALARYVFSLSHE